MGLPLPEGRTPSEKALIAKVKETTRPEKFERVPSEKLRKAKAAGLLTPLKGKTKEQKEKILKGLAMQGIPLPQAETSSEQKLIDRIRAEVGLPPEPKTPSTREKYDRAMAAGLITPLEGKSIGKKEQILRNQARMGLPLPEGRTPSEKALIAKVKETTRPEKFERVPSEKLRKAKAAGLLTPLKGKTKEQKEKILKGLAMQGIPLPEAETSSEQKLIDRIRAEVGLPPEPKTRSSREKYDRAMAAGLITPLEGKSIGKKEKILKDLAEAGLPLPEGTTPSEKALVQKVRTLAGLSPEPTPSEKREKSKKRSKKIGVGEISKSRKRVGISKSKGGVIEEFEDITKTTTCDRACGCDKKKIRFKHSYVKIRVTSPDISSLCPCPEECIPGVKGGVFTDNEGIKVTIGRVTGVPSFSSRELSKNQGIKRRTDKCPDLIGLTPSINGEIEKKINNFSDPSPITNNYSDFVGDFHTDDKIIFIKSFNSYHQNYFLENEVERKFFSYEASDSSSLESVYLLQSNSSMSFTAASDVYSIISFSVTETSSRSSFCLQRADYLSLEDDKIYGLNDNYWSNIYTGGSTFGTTDFAGSVTTYYSSKVLTEDSEKYFNREILLLEAIQSESYYQLKHLRDHRNLEPFTSYMNINSNSEILDTVSRVLSKSIFNDSSSLIIIMSTSSDEHDENDNYCCLDNNESTIFIQVSEKCSNWNSATHDLHSTQKQGFKLVTKGKNLKDMTLIETDKNKGQVCNNNLKVNEKHYTHCRPSQKAEKTQHINFSNDTSEDRPCCCKSSEINRLRTFCCVKEKRFENISLEFKTPKMLKYDVTQGACHEALNINDARNLMTPLQKSINPTPVRLCEIPTCSGHTGSHRPTENPKPIIYHNDPCNKLMDSYKPADTSRSGCATSNWVTGENSEKVKNIKGKSGCPCSYGYHGNHSQECDMIQENSNMKKWKSLTKKIKNVKCECPEEQLEFHFDMEDWIDEAQRRKMKSDLTQTVSGFKFNILRKTPEPEMSFEEILKFYADAYEQKYKTAECKYIKPKVKEKAAGCICPPEVEEKVELPAVSDEPFQGIKFHIGGKGSGSTGLSGILCFQ